MLNKTEKDERLYLEDIKLRLKTSLEAINDKVRQYAKEIKEQKAYLWENKTGMDHVEKISVRQSVDQSVYTAEAVRDRSRRIQKLLTSPYFGRFDFTSDSSQKSNPIYIGVHAFFDDDTNHSLIHDWRAPISTMFYDYETGEAEFESPSGTVCVTITLKRQYRIRNGKMDFMLESDLNIHDDVLQKELSLSSDDKMKNIVATIQRDQNAIIRNENSEVLIIQGVAGSGKTSIALHRIAFLLYRFKDTITSTDILIISPNKVFADYIANVLPELGEEKIPEMGIEELANELLSHKFEFQTFFQQVSLLLEKNDSAFQERIQAKATFEFLNKLNEYAVFMEENYFVSIDLTVNGRLVPSWFMKERFEAFPNMPIVNRLAKIVKDIETNIGVHYNYDITTKERAEIKTAVQKMFKFKTLRALYKDFYTWMKKPELCKFVKGSILEYSDVFPLIYLKMKWDGIKVYEDVKHLLVDEMQDYTPVQYAVMAKLFPCKKTILGDTNQSVNPFSSSSSKDIQKIFNKADCVQLNTSYRSTYEITRFAQKISPNTDLKAIERKGQEPDVLNFKNAEEELTEIKRLVSEFPKSENHSLGIICRTQKQAEHWYNNLKTPTTKMYLLSAESQAFRPGIIVCTAHMAKGLEFDHVIVPDVSSHHYKTLVDKSMLYVACTRAMHQLTLTYINTATKLLPK